MNFIYSQIFTSKIFISGGFSSVLILAYNHTQFEDEENRRGNMNSQKFTILALFKRQESESTVLNIFIMNLCNFAKVIISRCTKDASTINWWNENVCSSDDLKLDIPAHSQLITTQTRHTLYHTFMGKYPKMQISFEKFKHKLPRIQKYITNSMYW
jgi:hypothetical protein